MVELFNIDCMVKMAEYPDKYFDLAIVDPPYGIKRDKGFGGFGGFGKPIERKKYKGWGDEQTPTKDYFDKLITVSKNVIIWGGGNFLQTNYHNQDIGSFGTKSIPCQHLGTANLHTQILTEDLLSDLYFSTMVYLEEKMK